jgi:hypothetical protein
VYSVLRVAVNEEAALCEGDAVELWDAGALGVRLGEPDDERDRSADGVSLISGVSLDDADTLLVGRALADTVAGTLGLVVARGLTLEVGDAVRESSREDDAAGERVPDALNVGRAETEVETL